MENVTTDTARSKLTDYITLDVLSVTPGAGVKDLVVIIASRVLYETHVVIFAKTFISEILLR